MPTFSQQMAQTHDLTTEAQQKTGVPVAGTIDEEHMNFLKTLIALIDSGDIVLSDSQTFLKKEVYDALDEDWRDKADLALVNIANQLRLIYAFYKDNSFTNDSPQLQTMVEQLWQQKQAIEQYHDVFKF